MDSSMQNQSTIHKFSLIVDRFPFVSDHIQLWTSRLKEIFFKNSRKCKITCLKCLPVTVCEQYNLKVSVSRSWIPEDPCSGLNCTEKKIWYMGKQSTANDKNHNDELPEIA